MHCRLGGSANEGPGEIGIGNKIEQTVETGISLTSIVPKKGVTRRDT